MTKEIVFLFSMGLIIMMKIIVFILGYLTVRLGYDLIKSGVKGEFKFSAKLGGVKTDLASVSPGLLFVVLGIFLIGYAIYVEKTVEVSTPPQAKPNIVLPNSSPFEKAPQEKKKKESSNAKF